MDAVFLSAILIFASITGVGKIVPQSVRLSRLKVTDGVSAPWIGVSLVMGLWWITYSVQAQLWGVAPMCVCAFLLYGIIFWQMFQIDGSAVIPKIAVGIGAFGVIPLIFLLLGGWQAAGLVIGLLYSAQFFPALISTIRSPNAAGVSPATWVLAAVESIAWCYYGFVVDDKALLLAGAGAAIISSSILLCLVFRRRSAPEPIRVGSSSGQQQ